MEEHFDLQSEITIGGVAIAPNTRQTFQIPVSRLPTQTMLSLPVAVINGVKTGPRLWLSAAIHGDELNGVEIIRQVLQKIQPQQLHGTLIAVPIVNVFGFVEQSRYLPDRRDLNRCFPGSANGSLASRLANLFMQEIVHHSTHGIDLHTGAIHRNNLPQIRANLQDPETYRCAKAFGAPVIINSNLRDGSLRQAAAKNSIPTLLYEAGEALRFDSVAIDTGITGILRVMNVLGMYQLPEIAEIESIEVKQSKWIRAHRGGIFRLMVSLGEKIEKKQILGVVADAFGEQSFLVRSNIRGIVIGHTQNPLVNQGDAIIHLALLD